MERASKLYDKNFFGTVLYIQPVNLVQCVQELFTGAMWEKLYMQ